MIVRDLITRLGFDLQDGDIKKFNVAVDNIAKRADILGKKLATTGRNLTLFLTTPILAAGGAMIKAASDAQETQNRFRQVFGEIAKDAEVFAKDLGDQVGRSTIEIQNGLTIYQQFAQGLEFSSEQAFDFSKKMQMLALDFASFNNISDDEALQRFISALSGSAEVLDKFGINIKAAALEQELLNMGIAKSVNEATEQQKAIARLNIIEKVMGRNGVVGDAVRTAQEFENRLKALRANVKDLSIAFGNVMLPIATRVVKALIRFTTWIESFSEETRKLILIIAGIAAALGPGLFIFGKLISSFSTLVTVLKVLKTQMIALNIAALPITGTFWAIVAALGALYLIFDDINAYLNGRDSLFGGLYDKALPIIEDIKDAWSGFLSFVSDAALVFETDFLPTLMKVGQVAGDLFQAIIVDPLKEGFEILQMILSFLGNAIGKLGDFLSKIGVFKTIGNALKKAFNFIPAVAAFNAVSGGIQNRAAEIRSGGGIGGNRSQVVNSPVSMKSPVTINVNGPANPKDISMEVESAMKRVAKETLDRQMRITAETVDLGAN